MQTALTSSHGVVLTGLASGTTYYFVAESTGSNGATGYSTTMSFTTSGVSTSAPVPVISNVTTSGITGTSVTISWTTDQATTSLVNYGISTGYGSSSAPNSTLQTAHSVVLTGLTPGTTYDFDVVSANSANVVATSPNATFTTAASSAPPPYVGYVVFWGVTSSGVTIAWSSSVPATTQLAYGTTPALGQLTTLNPSLTSTHGVVLTGLASGTKYYFVAQSTDADGVTGYSTTYSFTTN